jgi:predicted DsbA family dithiol-disulfide isomerase
MAYGVLGLPALIVDGKVAVSGQVPSAGEIKGLLA